MDWERYILQGHTNLMKQRNTKELGKLRAYACELMVCDFLNTMSNNDDIVFIHNDDVKDHLLLNDISPPNLSIRV